MLSVIFTRCFVTLLQPVHNDGYYLDICHTWYKVNLDNTLVCSGYVEHSLRTGNLLSGPNGQMPPLNDIHNTPDKRIINNLFDIERNVLFLYVRLYCCHCKMQK